MNPNILKLRNAVDLEKIAEIIRENASLYIIPRFRNLTAGEISTKGDPDNFVTVADTDMEAALKRDLGLLYPEALVIGEETIAADKDAIKVLNDQGHIVFIIDPVDGTKNFKNGNAHFGSMLACLINGEAVASWVYDVMGDRMMIAERNSGTYIKGVCARTNGPRPASQIVGYADKNYFPAYLGNKISNLQAQFSQLERVYKSTSPLLCCAHEYLNIASGEADFMVCGIAMPWDHLAGTLAIKEAGGYVTRWNGSPYQPRGEELGLVVAANEPLMKELRTGVIARANQILSPTNHPIPKNDGLK